jgi:outer membrane murein-binding lipoprotein Lpp
MIRKLIAVAAVSGSLALGVAGGARGNTHPTPTAPPAATHAARCVKAEKVATRIQTLETKAAAWVPKAQARQAKATAAGHTKLAARIGDRITRVQKREAKGTALLAKIAAKCGTTTSAS